MSHMTDGRLLWLARARHHRPAAPDLAVATFGAAVVALAEQLVRLRRHARVLDRDRMSDRQSHATVVSDVAAASKKVVKARGWSSSNAVEARPPTQATFSLDARQVLGLLLVVQLGWLSALAWIALAVFG